MKQVNWDILADFDILYNKRENRHYVKILRFHTNI